MTMEVDDLYQEMILDHFRSPRNNAPINEGDALVEQENPTCGDSIRLNIKLEDGRVGTIEHDTKGCAVSVASASIMSDLIMGRETDDAKRIIQAFLDAMRSDDEIFEEDFGDAVAISGVRKYPLRIKCATMSWHAAKKAIDLSC